MTSTPESTENYNNAVREKPKRSKMFAEGEFYSWETFHVYGCLCSLNLICYVVTINIIVVGSFPLSRVNSIQKDTLNPMEIYVYHSNMLSVDPQLG